MNAEQARAIYKEIVRRKKDPALLTFAGHGLVRAQVFPIQPGETRKVALRYTQLLPRAGDALRLRYTFGDRSAVSEIGYTVSVSNAAAYGTPYSPTHHIDTRRTGDRLEISVADNATGQLELFLPLRQGLVGTSLVTHAPGGEGIVLFVTDGLPSVGEQAPDRIAEQAAGRIGRNRIFTVGIGPAVNTYLLDGLATRGRGAAEYVLPGASLETAMSALLAKLRYPALVDLKISESPVPLYGTLPTQLPDLFLRRGAGGVRAV